MYSKMDQVKFVREICKKTFKKFEVIHFLKALFLTFYLLSSWMHCRICKSDSGYEWSVSTVVVCACVCLYGEHAIPKSCTTVKWRYMYEDVFATLNPSLNKSKQVKLLLLIKKTHFPCAWLWFFHLPYTHLILQCFH